MLVTKQFLVCIEKSTFFKIYFYVQQKKETQTDLDQLEGD